MTREEIGALAALTAIATPGPWEAIDEEVITSASRDPNVLNIDAVFTQDAAFVAAARNAMPALLEEARRAQTIGIQACPNCGREWFFGFLVGCLFSIFVGVINKLAQP